MNTSIRSCCLSAIVFVLGVSCVHGRDVARSTTEAEHRPVSERCLPQKQPLPPSGEGMWPWTSLVDLDQDALRARGLEVPLETLWTPGQAGMLQAVAGLEGCSASFVSPDGLMLTNHHCVYAALQRNSTEDHDLIRDGFVARDRSEELDGQGIRAYVFRRHTDVTAKVLAEVGPDLSDRARMEQIEAAEKAIVAQCETTPNRRCRVASYNDGLNYVLLETIELTDVRLVAAPPAGLADFGGEVDNWHWPRHGTDFALVRAYTAPDGSPARYSPGNVPFHPPAFFTVSLEGVQPGQFVMVAGTPGRTRRYLTSAEVEDAYTWYYPVRAALFERWIGVLENACTDVPETCLRTAARKKTLNNSLTNARGTLAGMARNRVLERKIAEEDAWRRWVAETPERAAKYGRTLDDLLEVVEAAREGRDHDLLLGYALWGSDGLRAAWTITKWAREQEKPDAEREPGFQERDRRHHVAYLETIQGSTHPVADRRVLAMFLDALGSLPPEQHLGALDRILENDYTPAAIDRFLDHLYAHTRLFEADERVALFGQSLDTLQRSDDAFIQFVLRLTPAIEASREARKARRGALSRLRPPYLESLIAMRGARFYPDANGTPRVTFGSVVGYSPRDGVWYTPFTSLDGLVAKHTGKPPFDAPEVVRKAARHPTGKYRADTVDGVPLCFLSNCDTTGGNSGSPALDGKGRLVGLNFDRVYENIVGDFGYNPELSRNIMVDVRGILWYLDEVLHATRIVTELGVSPEPAPGIQGN